jgi:hypothetical protein
VYIIRLQQDTLRIFKLSKGKGTRYGTGMNVANESNPVSDLQSNLKQNDADPTESGFTAIVVRTNLCQVYPKDSAAEGR